MMMVEVSKKGLRWVWLLGTLLNESWYALPEYLRDDPESNTHLTEEERKKTLLQYLIFQILVAAALYLSASIALDESLFSPINCMLFGTVTLQCCFLQLLDNHKASVGAVSVMLCLQVNFTSAFQSLFYGFNSNDMLAWCVILPMIQFFINGKRAGMLTLKLVLIEYMVVFVLKEYILDPLDDGYATPPTILLSNMIINNVSNTTPPLVFNFESNVMIRHTLTH